MRSSEASYQFSEKLMKHGTRLSRYGSILLALGVDAVLFDAKVAQLFWIAGSAPTALGVICVQKGFRLQEGSMPPGPFSPEPEEFEPEPQASIIQFAPIDAHGEKPMAA